MGMFSPRYGVPAGREEEVYDNLKMEGFSDKAIAAIMGNMRQESSKFDYQETNPIGAKGMFQLKPGYKLDDYQRWLKDEGEVDSLESQIEFMSDSIQGPKKYRIPTGWGHTRKLQGMFSGDDMAKMVEGFYRRWEIPGSHDTTLPTRQRYAQEYYDQMKDYYLNQP